MEIIVKCIDKLRDKNGAIAWYRVKDNTGKTLVVNAKELKHLIRIGKVKVANLKLTSDNRLIDCKSDGSWKLGMDEIVRNQELAKDVVIHMLSNAVRIEECTEGDAGEYTRGNQYEFTKEYNIGILGNINISMLVCTICNLEKTRILRIECDIEAQDRRNGFKVIVDSSGKVVNYVFNLSRLDSYELSQNIKKFLKRAESAITESIYHMDYN